MTDRSHFWPALAVAVAAAAVAPATAPAGRAVVDRSHVISFTLDAAWKPLSRLMARRPQVLIGAYDTGGANGKTTGMTFTVLGVSGDSPKAVAADLVALAKETVPDQGDAGTVVAGTLDGEATCVVTTRTLINGHPSEQRDVLARHGGVVYDVTFACGEAQFAAAAPRIDAVMATARWTAGPPGR